MGDVFDALADAQIFIHTPAIAEGFMPSPLPKQKIDYSGKLSGLVVDIIMNVYCKNIQPVTKEQNAFKALKENSHLYLRYQIKSCCFVRKSVEATSEAEVYKIIYATAPSYICFTRLYIDSFSS